MVFVCGFPQSQPCPRLPFLSVWTQSGAGRHSPVRLLAVPPPMTYLPILSQQGALDRALIMGKRGICSLLVASICCITATQGGRLGEDTHHRQLSFVHGSGLKGPGRVESSTEREKWRVPWQQRSETDYREVESKATFHKLEDDEYSALDLKTPMRPLVPRIESQQCLMNLVRENSPITRSMSRKYIPKAYNLMSREYSYKGPGIPEAFKTPCFKKCAMVGSSGVLTGTKWGSVIDGYDAVIRLNNAPTYGHEEDVGSRTTVRIMHDFHIKEFNLAEMLRIDPGGFILVWPPEDKPKGLGGPSPKPEKTKYLAYWLEYSNATTLLTRFSRAGFYDAHMMARTHVGPFPPHVPSTGWNAFYSMLHFCQEVHAFGLAWQLSEESYRRAGHTKTGKAYYWYKHDKGNVNEDDYYYNRNIKNPNSFHGFDKEKIGMQTLATYYNIQFL